MASSGVHLLPVHLTWLHLVYIWCTPDEAMSGGLAKACDPGCTPDEAMSGGLAKACDPGRKKSILLKRNQVASLEKKGHLEILMLIIFHNRNHYEKQDSLLAACLSEGSLLISKPLPPILFLPSSLPTQYPI